jgi:hypothetical protein
MSSVPGRLSLGSGANQSEKTVPPREVISMDGVYDWRMHPAKRAEERCPSTVRVNDVGSEFADDCADSHGNPRIESAPEKLYSKAHNSQLRCLLQ